MALDRYYNLYDPTKHHDELLFRAGDGLQARELNEMQTAIFNRIAGVAGALFKEGDIKDGADIVLDVDTGALTLTPGTVYLRGAMRSVSGASFTVPTVGRVAVGVRYKESIVTELEDPTLRDPAVGTDNYLEPGAARRTYALAWGWEGPSSNDGGPGDFHAIYTLTNGVLDNRVTPPTMDAVTAALAKYDRDANGSYVVTGLTPAFVARDMSTDPDEYVFTLSEGRANINGYKVERVHSARLRYPLDPDTQPITGEPHVFTSGGGGAAAGSMRVIMNRTPLDGITAVRVTKEKTVSVTHGAYTGAVDTLPDSTIVQVLEIKQSATTYAVGTDYTVSGDDVSWAPTGAEPAPNSTYTVKYTYIDTVPVTGVDDDGFTVSGVVGGTTMYVDYAWRMPRVDVLAMTQSGETVRVKGTARVKAPGVPAVPADALAIASITHNWRADSAPSVRNVAVRTIPVAEIESMRNDISSIFTLVATQYLRTDASIRESGIKRGVFVDPFLDDTLRDNGVVQTAAVVGGAMTLPIGLDAMYTAGTGFVTLDYTLSPVLSQMQKTGSMLINPYQAFDPVPAKVALVPSVDEWTVVDTAFMSDSTTRFIQVGHFVPGFSTVLPWLTTTEVTDLTVSSTTVAAEFLRPLNVAYTVSGFGGSEALHTLLFDGIDLTPVTPPVANGSGVLSGTFTVPANIPQGSKRVEFRGVQGSYGVSTYVGNGKITTETRRRVVTITETHVDPLAQTFTLDTTRLLHAVDLWFTAKGGANDVIVQIRETEVGFPNRTVLSEGRIPASAIVLGGSHTRIAIDPLVAEAGREYALVVLTDDAAHAVAVAELGKNDPVNGWVTRQPYQIGVLLSSSNAVTWTAHQEKDMTFRLLAAEYTSTTKEVVLGTHTLTNASDLIALAAVDRPAANTDVEFVVVDASGNIHTLTEMQPLNLTDRISGSVTIKAVLKGGGTMSPVLYPDIKTAVGNLSVTGDYVSRGFQAAATFGLSVVLDTLLPGTATVAVYAESATTGNWVAVPFDSGKAIDNGRVERTFKKTGLTGVGGTYTTRLRVVLTGSPANRPFLYNLRAVAT
ncbi:DUF4815 domain-containing protein [Azospirillum doebereinerae]|uniref:DUF4815 domain-containing protein n=1 Tax=Azospirillum doebereinerae TaxID=92933 RepID=UPI001EE612F8|nr:DUF4815 domain-containing protein [Azospirillum doebereinerae]MCG5240098.1 DUF4815 domain-containing protein [Azospirillum doebereinerae]